jgi:transglutaminase-like putative cysteine protease
MSSMLRACLTGCFLFLQIYLSAQEKTENYIIGNLSDSLTNGADAVCRLDETDVEIISPGKIIIKQRSIYTILNENAEHLSTYYAHYNKLSTINDVEGTLYNLQGKEVKHFKKKDMADFPVEGEAFVSDDRMKIARLTYGPFPYTVEYKEEDALAGTYYLPRWEPPRSDKMSVQVSRYVLTTPADYKVRLKLINSDIQPVISEKKDKITYTWEVHNLPSIPDEPYAVSSDNYNPYMLVGPTNFELDGYKGDITGWQDYGKFYYSLYKGRDVLPDELKKQVHQLTDDVKDPYRKIAILYDYLQKNTHYVLIMFGIGGLQPYDAEYVAKNKYGDCKALSNFMVSLLKEAGINGYPVAIWGGEEYHEFVKDFPSHQSNHMICAVPLEKDTVWLECTSQFLPPGYLSSFTADRYGLLINENGGTLVHTPSYRLDDNVRSGKITAVMDADGNLQIKSESVYKALSFDKIESLIHGYTREKQMEYLKSSFNLPTYTVNSFNYKEDNSGRLPVVHEYLDISVANYATVTGKRVFINPDIFQHSAIKFSDKKDRKLDFEFKAARRESDTVEIAIPAGYMTETKPKDVFLDTPFGRFQTHLVVTDNKIMFYRKFDNYSGRFPASKNEEIKTFYKTVYDADRNQIVLVKKPA